MLTRYIKVLEYIEAENEYTDAMMAHTESLQERLYDEMRARVVEADTDYPTQRDGTHFVCLAGNLVF